MKYRLPKYSDKELLEIFPEAREIIPLKIKECKKIIKEKERKIATVLNEIYALKADAFSEWFGEEIIKMFMMPDLLKAERILFRLNNFKYLINPKKENHEQFEFKEKIEIAKRYPIEELLRNVLDLRKNGTKFIALCPLHEEKTPSFYIYPESNRYYCFGCQAKGDVITLTMALHGINFKEAVAMLQN